MNKEFISELHDKFVPLQVRTIDTIVDFQSVRLLSNLFEFTATVTYEHTTIIFNHLDQQKQLFDAEAARIRSFIEDVYGYLERVLDEVEKKKKK